MSKMDVDAIAIEDGDGNWFPLGEKWDHSVLFTDQRIPTCSKSVFSN